MDKMLDIKLLLGEHLDRMQFVKNIIGCKSNKLSEIAQACVDRDTDLGIAARSIGDTFLSELFDLTQL